MHNATNSVDMDLTKQVKFFLLLVALAVVKCDVNDCNFRHKFDASKVGIIESPYFGEKNYGSSLQCVYTVTAPEGYRIKLTFKDFDVAPSSSCNQDKLIVLRKDAQTVLGIFCGNQLPNPILSYEGESQVWLIFQSDFLGTGKGFRIQYESSPYFTSVCKEDELQCKNRNCFTKDLVCDGVDDCGDGTDEEDCGLPYETYPKKCGKQYVEPDTIFRKQAVGSDRMVGGDEVVPHSWPWQVSLQDSIAESNGHFCGGTLINAQWVLTASHCVDDFWKPGKIRIHFGAHYKFKKTKYEQIRWSKKVIAYPDLEEDKIKRFSMSQDISLIKLNAPVKFTKGVQPACLPNQGWKPEVGLNCYVTGWGLTRGSGGTDVLKQQLQVVQPPRNCSHSSTFDDRYHICVKQEKMSPCQGDSGGPLHCRVDNKWYVFGATSSGKPSNFRDPLCIGPKAITLYTSSAAKADWITSIINKYS